MSKFLIDSDGNKVNTKYIGKDMLKRDKVVNGLFKDAEKLHGQLIKTKEKMLIKIDEYLESVADQYSVEWKGNTALLNFSAKRKVEITISDRISFSEKLNIAKELIDRCIEKWSKDASDKLKPIIDKAFSTDRKSKVDVKQILKLRTLKYKDAEWEEAMKLINEAITIEYSKRYVKFYDKDKEGKWKALVLNFSAI